MQWRRFMSSSSSPRDLPNAETPATRNWILRSLPAPDYAQVLPFLEPVALEVMQRIVHADEDFRYVHFPETGIISLLTELEGGTLVENGTVGMEGVAGFPIALGVTWSPVLVVGQVPGVSRRIAAAKFADLLDALPALQRAVTRYAVFFNAQVSQSLACNSVHGIEQRCARWLLMSHDRVPGDEFTLTHEILAQMLAVRRSGVTVAAGALQRAGLIRYHRGRMTITDREGLESAACECYGMLRKQRDRLLGAMP
jgi:CRP-like cAMP-binding protein